MQTRSSLRSEVGFGAFFPSQSLAMRQLGPVQVGQRGSLRSMSAVGVTSASAGISAKVSIPAKPIPIPFAGVGFGDRTGAGMSELGFR